VNPGLCATLPLHSVQLPVRAQLLAPEANAVDSIRGNLDILSVDKQHVMIQVQGAAVVPVSMATVSDDRTVFSYTKLGVAAPDGELALGELKPSNNDIELGAVRERLAFFYYRSGSTNLLRQTGQSLSGIFNACGIRLIRPCLSLMPESIPISSQSGEMTPKHRSMLSSKRMLTPWIAAW
jgi:hypothetical protein